MNEHIGDTNLDAYLTYLVIVVCYL